MESKSPDTKELLSISPVNPTAMDLQYRLLVLYRLCNPVSITLPDIIRLKYFEFFLIVINCVFR